MTAESKPNNQVVMGRTMASFEQKPFTIGDQLNIVKT